MITNINSIAERLPLLRRRLSMLQAIRAFFDARGYIEVETPYLVPTPGEEVHLMPFHTLYETPQGDKEKRFLHTSPEFAMKRILAAIKQPVYQLARVWRNGEESTTHSPEFTMLEWYRPYCDLNSLMDETETLLKGILPEQLHYHGHILDLTLPFERLTIQQAFEQYVGVDVLAIGEDAEHLAQAAHCALRAGENWEDLFFRLLLQKIEPYIGREKPTFLTHWPISQAALARSDSQDSRVALRFELYAGGLELGNAFEELTDSMEQRQRFSRDRERRRQLYPSAETWEIDEEFLKALNDMPPCSGIAMGFDRLVMLAIGAHRIQDVLWI